MQPNNQAQKPFFAKFLENQAGAKEAAMEQEAGLTIKQAESKTLKFPSDDDEVDLWF
jgi:hypothetical protein